MSRVPQGSALSPTVYTTYTADIPPPAIDCAAIQYADDTTGHYISRKITTHDGRSNSERNGDQQF